MKIPGSSPGIFRYRFVRRPYQAGVTFWASSLLLRELTPFS